MEKILKIYCDNCETDFKIVYKPEDGDPNSCPFCGRDLSISSNEQTEETEIDEWEN